MKENIYILIENESELFSKVFESEILKYGKVKFYNRNKQYIIIDCINNELINPPKYNCLLLDGKYIHPH